MTNKKKIVVAVIVISVIAAAIILKKQYDKKPAKNKKVKITGTTTFKNGLIGGIIGSGSPKTSTKVTAVA